MVIAMPIAATRRLAARLDPALTAMTSGVIGRSCRMCASCRSVRRRTRVEACMLVV